MVNNALLPFFTGRSGFLYVLNDTDDYLRVWDLSGVRQADKDIHGGSAGVGVHVGVTATPTRIYVLNDSGSTMLVWASIRLEWQTLSQHWSHVPRLEMRCSGGC